MVNGMMCWHSTCIHEDNVVFGLTLPRHLFLSLCVCALPGTVLRKISLNFNAYQNTTQNMHMDWFIVLFCHSHKNWSKLMQFNWDHFFIVQWQWQCRCRYQCTQLELISIYEPLSATTKNHETIFIWFYYSLLFHFGFMHLFYSP